MSYRQLKKKSKSLITSAMATAMFAGPLLSGGTTIVQASQNKYYLEQNAQDKIDYYLNQDIIFISEYEFLESKDNKVILEEIPLDDYTTLVRYEYENADGYIEKEARIIFKKVAISTWMGFQNPEVTRRLGTTSS